MKGMTEKSCYLPSSTLVDSVLKSRFLTFVFVLEDGGCSPELRRVVTGPGADRGPVHRRQQGGRPHHSPAQADNLVTST